MVFNFQILYSCHSLEFYLFDMMASINLALVPNVFHWHVVCRTCCRHSHRDSIVVMNCVIILTRIQVFS